ncbi:hypothetical protein ACH5RR_009131 [Cinchona calisaya]|uniref:Uncharacterized protein n=1 Tax=Cinchona calisaya TaxID=153742 RepID=A0ABD3ADQ3_9GENT
MTVQQKESRLGLELLFGTFDKNLQSVWALTDYNKEDNDQNVTGVKMQAWAAGYMTKNLSALELRFLMRYKRRIGDGLG